MKLGLILSNDWELFGDGSGDYWSIQHEPLRQLLDTVEAHGAKLTVMAELGQQWAHQKLAATAPWARDISQAWEEVLRETVQRGCDVQMHLHPQWLNARHDGDRWVLDFDNWATSSLPAPQLEQVLGDGKRYLESFLQSVRGDYECLMFRAGAFCIEPSANAIAALERAGFQCDTSVTKGLHQARFYDYRDAHSNLIPWHVSGRSVKHAGSQSLLELPIFSVQTFDSPVLRRGFGMHYGRLISAGEKRWQTERQVILAARYPSENRGATPTGPTRRRQIADLLHAWARRTCVSLDYDCLPASVFLDLLEKAWSSPQLKPYRDQDCVVPLMALGHAKLIHNCANLERILAGIQRRMSDKVTFCTAREAVRLWERQPGKTHFTAQQDVGVAARRAA